MLAAAILGAGAGCGVLLVVLGVAGRSERLPSARFRVGERAVAPRVAVAVLAGVVAFLFTGWLIGGVLVALAASTLPGLVRSEAARHQEVARTEAVAGWTEMLRDTMAAAAGLEEALRATAPLAPPPIRPAVIRLAARLEHDRLVPALRAFGDELADPAGDLVVTALALAGSRQCRDLGRLLGALATSARAEAATQLRIDAGRARTRTAVRVITLFTVGFAAGMVVLNRPYLRPYDPAPGQLVLGLVGACFAGSIAQLQRMARSAPPPRILVAPIEGS